MAIGNDYTRVNWKDESVSKDTPLNAADLNTMDAGILKNSQNIGELDTKKLDIASSYSMVKAFDINNSTGIITVEYVSGTKKQWDLNLMKIPVDIDFDETTQELIFTLQDGTKKKANVSSLVGINEFDSPESKAVIFEKDVTTGHISATIRSGGVKSEMLDPSLLTDVNKSIEASELAESYAHGGVKTPEGEDIRENQDEDNSKYYSDLAQSYAKGGTNIRIGELEDNGLYYKNQCQTIYENAKELYDDVQAGILDININVDYETGWIEWEVV